MAIKLTAPLSSVPESTVFWNWVEVPSPCFKSIPKWQKKDGMAYSVNASLSWWQGQNKMVKAWLACSRLRDSGGKSFSNKKCEKRAGAGERHRHRPLSQVVVVLISLLISSHYTYYLRAWHRLKRDWNGHVEKWGLGPIGSRQKPVYSQTSGSDMQF